MRDFERDLQGQGQGVEIHSLRVRLFLYAGPQTAPYSIVPVPRSDVVAPFTYYSVDTLNDSH